MKQLEEFLALECEIFDVLELIIFPDKEYDDFLAKLAGTLPNKKANKRAFEVERLFYSASFAADSVAEDNFSSLMRADSGRKKAENESCAIMCYDEEIEKLSDLKLLPVGKKLDIDEQTKRLFMLLRKADDMKVTTIYTHLPYKEGKSRALYNRMIRACAHRVIGGTNGEL
jgi:hypothetical protein